MGLSMGGRDEGVIDGMRVESARAIKYESPLDSFISPKQRGSWDEHQDESLLDGFASWKGKKCR